MAEIKGRKKVYCDVCNTFISSEPLLVIHNNGKKHQRLLKAREDRKESTERSIYVRGFENKVTLDNDLNEYFAQFGEVSSIFVDKEKAKYAIIEFECPTVPQAILALKQLPLFFGKHLIIKKRTFKEPMQQNPKQPSKSKKEKVSKEKTGSFLEEDVVEGIRRSPTLNEQVLAVVLSTCLNDDDLKLRSLIVQYLQEIFVEIFPRCVVTTFGSTVTGLGLKGADLDLCLLVDPEVLNLVLYQDESLPSSSDLTEQLLQFIVNILRKFAAGFRNVVNVSTAKCPVVKFIHRDSGLSCDLSINNRLAIRNTELIKSYVSLDDRIRPLAITLKNWGAAKRLTGSGGRQISNYCLVLMLFHYLQRTRPPVISVLQLLSESEGMLVGDASESDAEKAVIDGWDCSFSSTTAVCQNNDSLGTLLKGWFYYYGATFDYVNDVVTIQHDINRRVLKASIEESLSQVSVKPTFKPSVFCVQDPFELSHNLTQNVSEEALRSFIQSCQEAYTVLSNNSEQTKDGCVMKPTAFIELFSVPAGANQRAKKSHFSFTIPYLSSTTFPHTSLEQMCKFITDLLNNKLQITCEFYPDQATDDQTQKLGSLPTENEVVDNSMSVDEEDVSLVASRKRPHEEESFTVKRIKRDHESGNTTFCFLCKSSQVTWQNRRRQRRLQTANEDSMNSAEGSRSGGTEKTNILGNETVQNRNQNPEQFSQNVTDKSPTSASCMEVSSPAFDTNVDIPVMEFKLTICDDKGSNSSAGFIRKVFAILSIQLLVTVGVICLFLFVPSVEKAGKNGIVYGLAYALFIALYFVLVCCDSVRRSHPLNLILLSLFTLALSYLVGVISSFHETNIVLIMMGVTAIVTICVSLFACQTRFDMTKYGGVLFVFALVMFFVLVFSPVFLLLTTVGKIAIGGALALLFTAFMVYDVQLIMGGRKYELSEEEYVFGALILYVDIINILIILLYLFGGSSN